MPHAVDLAAERLKARTPVAPPVINVAWRQGGSAPSRPQGSDFPGAALGIATTGEGARPGAGTLARRSRLREDLSRRSVWPAPPRRRVQAEPYPAAAAPYGSDTGR